MIPLTLKLRENGYFQIVILVYINRFHLMNTFWKCKLFFYSEWIFLRNSNRAWICVTEPGIERRQNWKMDIIRETIFKCRICSCIYLYNNNVWYLYGLFFMPIGPDPVALEYLKKSRSPNIMEYTIKSSINSSVGIINKNEGQVISKGTMPLRFVS